MRQGMVCDDDLIGRLTKQQLEMDVDENLVLGVVIGGIVLRSTEDEIAAINDKSSVLVFTFIVCLAASFAAYWASNR